MSGSGGWSPPTATPGQYLKTEAADLSTLPPFQLYDLMNDPAESVNLVAKHPEIVQRLGRQLRDHILRGRDAQGDRPAIDIRAWPQLVWLKSFQ